MAASLSLAILSDVHFACASEQARGDDYELAGVTSPFLRGFLKAHNRFVWLHRKLHQNHLLDQFLAAAGEPDVVIANGDFSCDTGFIGMCDDAACASGRESLGKLRARFGPRFRAVFGDHELGKRAFVAPHGGMRLASFKRAESELGIEPFWRVDWGRHVLLGVTSSLIALPVFQGETLPDEWPAWQRLRSEHLEKIRGAFASLQPDQRVLLFCHDPSALPFLGEERAVREKLSQIEQTVIGHLHSEFIFKVSRALAGMPTIHFLGPAVRRMSAALGQRKHWQPFRVRLCPSLAGIELFKDGGYLTAQLDYEGKQPVKFQFHRIRR